MSILEFNGFNDHRKLQGCHAILGASKSSWLRYDDEKLIAYYNNAKAAERGTELHAFAATCIKLGQKLPHSKKTLNMYVNDAIGFDMTPEVVLFYSENCFGTADAISFRNGLLRIHDYKSGSNAVKMDQLMIYAAFFCLEYHIKPHDIQTMLRIYQNDEILPFNPTPDQIMEVCDKIVQSDNLIKRVKGGLIL